MIYTQSERKQFAGTIKRFDFLYEALIKQMEYVYREKAEERDVDTPLHHRMSPLYMLSVIQAKCRRLDAMLTRPGWEEDEHLRDRVVEECIDAANYALYISAFCWLIDDEEPAEGRSDLQAANAQLAEAAASVLPPELPAKMGIQGEQVILRFADRDVNLGTHKGADLEAIQEFIAALRQGGN